jgi:hypothetical protein
MCSKSNPIVVFALDLMSTYEEEHMILKLGFYVILFVISSTCTETILREHLV